MERRLLTFIVASTAFFFFYMTLRTLFGPPPPAPVAKNDADVVGEDEGALADAPAAVEDDQGTQLPAEGAAPGEATGDEPGIKRPPKPTWLTLGSMDQDSGHFMLVTLTTRGGGVERIELTERNDDGRFKYRRVDVRNGYLGYLAGTPAAQVDGVRVNVVGPATPADRAGIKVGDIVVAVAGEVVVSGDDIRRALQDTKPGDEVSIEVLRASSDDVADSPQVAESPDVLGAQDDAGSAAPRGPPIVLKATLTEHPLDVVRLAANGGADQIQGNLSRLSCLVTLGQINRKAIASGERAIKGITDPAELIWSSETDSGGEQQSAEFSVTLGQSDVEAAGGKPIRFHRSYTLAPNSYALGMSVEIENLADEPQQLAYRLEGPNGITLEGWWYSNKISPHFSAAAARDIVYNNVADGHELISGYELLKRAKKETKAPDQNIFAPDGDSEARNLKYICVDAQYFTVGYMPPVVGGSLTTFRRASAGVVADPAEVERHKERAVNCTFFLDSEVGEVPPGQSLRQEFQMFAGPKRPEVLAEHGLGDCVYYGWFAPFAKILASLLHVLWNVVGSYAVAIIILTVIVRGAMFPLSRKAAVNAQRMQELAPELKKIAEQYKDDMEGRLKAQRELQQRVGFNPLAGCLPMFLQLPIFIGLYRALSVDIELRGEPFSSMTSWASNLAGPDMLAYWGDWLWEYLSGRGTGWLGPYFNILPVIVVALFLAQQKMFMPPATDEQTAMTQKMMSIMTLMMGLFFFRVPAGLCIYFITSSLWGICERILVKKTLPSAPHFDASVLEGTAKPTEKSVSLADRIRQQVTKPEEPAERPNKRRRPNGKKKK